MQVELQPDQLLQLPLPSQVRVWVPQAQVLFWVLPGQQGAQTLLTQNWPLEQ